MVRSNKSAACSVLLLDALHEHLGVVHTLADTGRFCPTTVAISPDNALRFSRKCRHFAFPDWNWHQGAAQLHSFTAPADRAVLLPLSLRATEWAIRNRAQLAENWRVVPLPELNDFQLANDKLRLAELASQIGLRTPNWASLADAAAHPHRAISFPVLLKPRRGFGGSGIVRLETPADLTEVMGGLSSPTNYFVQTLVPGVDVSCGVLCRDGEVVASAAYRPLAREGRYGQFTSIQSVDYPEVFAAVARLMRALRWSGIANVDLVRSHDGSAYVLEVNPRCWGNMAASLSLGINFADRLCRAACGEDLAPIHGQRGRFFNTLDSLALLRAALVDGTVRRSLDWRRLLRGESSLCRVACDPLPYLAALSGAGAFRGGYRLLREIWTRQAPNLMIR